MRLWTIALKDVRQIVRDRRSAMFLVLMPVVFTLFLGIAFRWPSHSDTRPLVGLADSDSAGALPGLLANLLSGLGTRSEIAEWGQSPALGAPQSGTVPAISVMSRAGLVRVQQLTAAEAQKADELVRRGRFDAVVLVPAGYAQSLLAGSADSSFIPHPSSLPGAAGLDVVCDQASPDGQAALQAVQTALGRMRLSAVIGRLAAGDRDEGGRTTGRSQKSDGRSQMSEVRSGRGRTTEGGPDSSFIPHPSSLSVAAFAAQAGKTWSSPALTIASEPATGEPAKVRVVANGFNQASPGTLVQFTIFGVMTAAMLLVFERRSRTLARLLSTPATKVEVIGGHVLAMFIVTFLQGLLLVVLGQLAFGVHYLNNIAGVLCVLAALSLWVASLGLLIGTLAKGPEQVSVFSMIAMFFFAAGGGAWFPLEITGRAFSTMGHLLPSAWAMDGLQNVAVRGLGFGSVVVPVLVLAGYAALFFALAVARFRVEN